MTGDLGSSEGPIGKLLIIGAAVGYPVQKIRVFLDSLIASGFGGELVLIVDKRLSVELGANPQYAWVQTVVVPRWIPFRFRLHQGRRRRLLPLWLPARIVLWLALRLVGLIPLPQGVREKSQFNIAKYLLAPTEFRFLQARRIVKGGDCDRIILTDVRDVVFQQNPEPVFVERGLYVGVESVFCLREQPFNKHWLMLAYGPKMLELIGGRPISCSGFTYGDRGAILAYLTAMEHEIVNIAFKATFAPLDQALHNVVLHTGKVERAEEMRNFSGPLLTLSQPEDAGAVRTDNEGRVLNSDGTMVCVLHMYDRWPNLKHLVLQRLERQQSLAR